MFTIMYTGAGRNLYSKYVYPFIENMQVNIARGWEEISLSQLLWNIFDKYTGTREMVHGQKYKFLSASQMYSSNWAISAHYANNLLCLYHVPAIITKYFMLSGDTQSRPSWFI